MQKFCLFGLIFLSSIYSYGKESNDLVYNEVTTGFLIHGKSLTEIPSYCNVALRLAPHFLEAFHHMGDPVPLKTAYLLSSVAPVTIIEHSFPDSSAYYYLADHIIELKEQGITHIGLEIGENFQKEINAYLNGKSSDDQLRTTLQSGVGERIIRVFEDFIKDKEGRDDANNAIIKEVARLMNTIKAAKKAGMKVAAISPKIYQAFPASRDNYTADNIREVLGWYPDAKMVCILSRIPGSNLPSKLGEIKSTSYFIDSPQTPSPIRAALGQMGMSLNSLFVPVSNKDGFTGFIYLDEYSNSRFQKTLSEPPLIEKEPKAHSINN